MSSGSPTDDRSLRGLTSTAAWNLILRVAGQGLGFLSFVFLARVVGEVAFGWLVLVLAWCSIGGLVATGGMDFVLLRHLRPYLDASELAKGRGLGEFAATISLGLGAIIAMAMLSILPIAGVLEAHQASLAVLIPVIPASAFISIRRNQMLALDRALLAQIPMGVVRPATTILLILVFHNFADSASPELVGSLSVSGGFVIAALVAFAAGWRHLRPFRQATSRRFEHREWLKIGFAMLLATSAFVLLNQIDTILLGTMRSEAEVGAYNSAYRIAMVLGLPMIALQAVVASRISKAHAEGRLSDVRAIGRWVSLRATMIVGPMCIGLFVGRQPLLAMFGESFVVASTALIVMTIAQLFNAWTGPTGYLLHLTGRQNRLALLAVFACIANTAGNLLLIPRFGMEGAAVSTAVCLGGMQIACLHSLRASLGGSTVWKPGAKGSDG